MLEFGRRALLGGGRLKSKLLKESTITQIFIIISDYFLSFLLTNSGGHISTVVN